jgi:protoheme IX farnesyltransferase
VAVTLYTWVYYREIRWLKLPLTLSLVTAAIQAVTGRLVVGSGGAIPAAIHFFLALVSLALILIPLVIAQTRYPMISGSARFTFRFSLQSSFTIMAVWTMAAILAMLVLGIGVSASGARSACAGWPLCDGSSLPSDPRGWLNLSHRGMSLIGGILMVLLLVKTWRTQRHNPAVLVAATTAAVLLAAQALMGIVEAREQYPNTLLGLHSGTAIAVWSAMTVLVTLVGSGSGAASNSEDSRFERPRRIAGMLRDYLVLTKPVVVALLLVTTFAGMVVGAQSWPSFSSAFWTLLAGFLAAGGSGAINQYIDRYDDVKMQRTEKRPIPSGRLSPAEGLAFGVAATIAAFYLMVAMVNFLAGVLTLAGAIYYVLIYSILLKKTTVQNIVIGGGAGAIPPLVGWAAATGSLNIPSLFLFAVVFMWTPPHFWALALVRRVDYARAGVPMLPVVRGEKETRWQIFLYTLELVALTLVLPVFGLGGGIYLVSAAFLGVYLILAAWRVWRGTGNKVAWRMYRHSSMYLAFLFLALMVDALI